MCICNKILVPVIVLILLPQILVGRKNNFVPRIVNGYQCSTTKVPFYVAILHWSGCGGSLLTYEWVLTASHCILAQHLHGVIAEVHSGFDLSPELRQKRYIKKVYQHPKFNESAFIAGDDFRYDIGLILLNEPFVKNAAIQVGTFPAPGFTDQCSQVWAAGIGKISSDENVYAYPILQRPLLCVNLTIVKNCEKSYPGTVFDENIFCAYAEKKDTCQGDSGGPLICDKVVIGIVSYGPTPCGDGPKEGTYTRIESYYDFINPIIKFTSIEIKHGSVEDTSSSNDKKVNETSGNDKKPKKTSAKNGAQAQIANWKVIFVTLLCYFVVHP